ncbi:MAG: sulfopyruvate decarboxylase subunit beta [Candidatus Lokiarchaeota archaeon]|nr:sulfopyruvate decarboxylase subunit beta [Candidatus Lokiarchaeota archaeon]
MDGYQIIQQLRPILTGNEVIVSSNGNISRQVYHYLPQPQVYLRGSMGLPASVGLGVALARPEKTVLVILGDGNLLMGLSSLTTASYIRPENLRLLILDNHEYATTGKQATTSKVLNYDKLFEGFGIPNIETINLDDSLETVQERLQKLLSSSGLHALPAIVTSQPPKLSNIPLHPEEITRLQFES